MKTAIKFILLLALTLSSTSCLTMMALSAASAKARIQGDDFGKDQAKMVLKTFQRITNYAALATTGSGDVVCVIADFGEYYDGLELDGRFIKKGTYSYKTTSGAQKTALAYLYWPDRKNLDEYSEAFLRNNDAIVVDTPILHSI